MSADDVDWKRKLKGLGLSRPRRARTAAAAQPAPAPLAEHVARGREGERGAAAFLRERGLVILDGNVRYPDGELDLVAEGPGKEPLLFVEVRRRRDASRGTPEESVTARKRARLVRAARRWLAEHRERPRGTVRFDVIAIQDEPRRIDWIQGAFDATT